MFSGSKRKPETQSGKYHKDQRPSKVPNTNSSTREEQSAIRWLQIKQNVNTNRAYESALRQYSKWMTGKQRTVESTTEVDIVLYIKYMLEGKETVAASNSIIGAVAAIRNHFRYDPVKSAILSGPMITDALKIGKRDGKQVVKKRPLTVDMLHAMYAWHTSPQRSRSPTVGWTDSRDLCMIILMMACFLRESEVVNLYRQDIRIKSITKNGVSREILEVYVRRAKNDQAGQGHLILVGSATESSICPVWWTKLTINRGRSSGVGSGKLFHTSKGDSLTRSTPCNIVQKWVERINSTHSNQFGDPKSYGSHSCRIGGVTAAHAAGIDMTLIQQHGNWKSDVVYDYIQPSTEQQLSVTEFIQASAAATSASE